MCRWHCGRQIKLTDEISKSSVGPKIIAGLNKEIAMDTSLRTVHGKTYFTAEWGKPGSQTILGIHGLTANCCHMAVIAEFLAGGGRHVLAYDVRGRGDSSPAENPSTLRRHAQDAVEIISTLPAERVLILGYSMGAYIGSIAAGLSDKAAGLVLFDGGGMPDKAGAIKLAPALARLDKIFARAEDYVEAAKPGYAALGLPWNEYIEAAVRHEIGLGQDGRYKYKGEAERVKEDLLDIGQFKHQDVFARIKCPVLLVHAQGGMGQGGPLFGESAYDITRKCLPDLTFYQTRANHYTMMLERQPEMNREVEAFVSGCGF